MTTITEKTRNWKAKLKAIYLIITGKGIYLAIAPPKDRRMDVYCRINTHDEAVALLRVAMEIQEYRGKQSSS